MFKLFLICFLVSQAVQPIFLDKKVSLLTSKQIMSSAAYNTQYIISKNGLFHDYLNNFLSVF